MSSFTHAIFTVFDTLLITNNFKLTSIFFFDMNNIEACSISITFDNSGENFLFSLESKTH